MAGCTSLETPYVIEARTRGEGAAAVYAIGEDQAYAISRSLFAWTRSPHVEDHRKEGYLVASFARCAYASGPVVGVWIERIDKENTKVTAVARDAYGMTWMEEREFHGAFHARFAEAVENVKAGKSADASWPKVPR